MPELTETTRGRVDGAMSLLARRKLMQLRDEAPFCDEADCAQILHAAGFDRASRLVMDVATVRAGFSPFRRRALADGFAHFEGFDANAAADARQAGPMARAVAELAGLMQAFPAVAHAAVERREPSWDARAAAAPTDAADLASLCDGLRRALDDDAGAQTFDRLEARLAEAREAVLDRPPLDAAVQAGAEVSELAERIAGESLRRFLDSRRLLAYPPFGSAALLHRAARLRDTGLGPYFCNVAALVEAGFSLSTFAHAAAGQTAGIGPRIENWIDLMSSALPDHLMRDTVEELAETDALDAIWAILAQGPAPAQTLTSARDVALDAGDFALASLAQNRIARAEPSETKEWKILGDIEGSWGRSEPAERAYARAIQLSPDDAEIADRLQALRAGQFERYFVVGGLLTSQNRQERRDLRRQPLPAAWRP